MASKVIYMDGVATAHLRADGSVRIELAAGVHPGSIESSLARVPTAIRRASPARLVPPQGEPLSGPRLAAAPEIELEGRSTPAGAADRAS